ncbi:hypothetical protein BRD17_07015 [Halobacteriales archaeon SW_7_68_16]|nr:MAG: hypothetical protein BRD17_07015 [Halobacteriales archaeon SW_7_68_16]
MDHRTRERAATVASTLVIAIVAWWLIAVVPDAIVLLIVGVPVVWTVLRLAIVAAVGFGFALGTGLRTRLQDARGGYDDPFE